MRPAPGVRRGPRPPAGRRGKSLIEVMVIIVWSSILVGIAGQMLYRLARVERAGRDEAVIGRSEFRLARDLRADARGATAVALLRGEAGDPTGVRLDTPAGAVEYAAAADGVRRTVFAGETTRREAYRLGPVAVAFAVEGDRFVTVAVRPRRADGEPSRFAAGPLRVVAALSTTPAGRDGTNGRLRMRGAGNAANPQASTATRPPVEAPRPAATPVNPEDAP